MDTTSPNQIPALRDTYGALRVIPDWVGLLLTDLDDGIAWQTGIESDDKRRGHAVNTAVYSYDELRRLAIVQVRQCIFHPRRFSTVRKNYFLIGRNESGRAFAHPIEAQASGRIISADPAAGVRLALTRIWDCDEEDLDAIVRNGDVAFVPVRRLPDGAQLLSTKDRVIRDTHHVHALAGAKLYCVVQCTKPSHQHTEMCKMSGAPPTKSGDIGCLVMNTHGYNDLQYEHTHTTQCPHIYYVVGRAKIEHSKQQHPTARIRGGIWRVQAGLRATVWDFSRATVD